MLEKRTCLHGRCAVAVPHCSVLYIFILSSLHFSQLNFGMSLLRHLKFALEYDSVQMPGEEPCPTGSDHIVLK